MRQVWLTQKKPLTPRVTLPNVKRCMHKYRISITRKLWDSAPMGRDVSYRHVLPRQMWSFCVKECRREAQKLGSAGALWWVRGLHPKNMPLSHVLPCRICCSRSNGASVKEIRPKSDPRVTPIKVTQGHRNQTNRSATHNLLLSFQSNHGPVSYCFGDKWRFLSKIANVPTTRALNTPLIGSLGIG